MMSITDKAISCIVFITGLVIFCLFLTVRSFGQTTIKEKMVLTPDSSRRTSAASAAISTAAANVPVQYVAKHSGKFKMIFEEGKRKANPFNKKSSLTITVTDATGKQRYERKYFPGDYFPSFITGDLSPDCPDTWYLYGKGSFEWDSGVTPKAINDAWVFSLSCSSEYGQSTNHCQTTNFGNSPRENIIAWTWWGAPAVIRSYLRFNDFKFTGPAHLDTAVLSLYESGRSWALSGSNAFTVSTVTGPWDENTLNWQNRPGAGSPSVPGPGGTGNAVLDVTSIVRGWVANPGSNYGFHLSLQNEQHYRNRSFWSSEGSIPPHLMAKVSNPTAKIDTLVVTDVKKGDVITLDYAGNGNVISTVTTGLSREINGKQVTGQQYDFKISDFSCLEDYNYSEQVKAFGWVTKPPSDEILLGQTKYYAAVKDPNSHTGKIMIKQVPVDNNGKPIPPTGIITGAFKGNPIHILSGSDTSGVYWDRKREYVKTIAKNEIVNGKIKKVYLDTIYVEKLPKGVIRVIGRYWQAGKIYKVKIMPTNNIPSAGMTITVTKPGHLGNTYENATDIHGHYFSINSMIIKNAGKYGIPPQLTKAQMWKEAAKVDTEFTPSYRYEPYYYTKKKIINNLKDASGRFFIKDSSSTYFADIPNHKNVHKEHYFRHPHTIWDIVKKYSQLVKTSASAIYGKRLPDGKMDYMTHLGYKTIQDLYDGIYIKIARNTDLTQAEIIDSTNKRMVKNLKYEWRGGLKYKMAQTRVGSSYGWLQMLYSTAREGGRHSLYSINNLPENLNANAFFVKCIQYQNSHVTTYLNDNGEHLNDNWTDGYYKTLSKVIFKLWNKNPYYGPSIIKKMNSYLPIK
jgi:hypothetical protein